ncbi:hypothetical protein TRICI_001468 [Trichomonascus ciferrii]|uniref:Uncharacterized protein n=1 Tax=Trichomonascus ciferrii TaxID=44093 RepID=A0A642V8D7_9ASCO|nr:hypothetical protein TRICI_001468 [Trichomonascus ciferrii]
MVHLNPSLIPVSRPNNPTARLERLMTDSARFLKFTLLSSITSINLGSDSPDSLFDTPGIRNDSDVMIVFGLVCFPTA